MFHDRTYELSTGQVAIGGECRTLPSQISAVNRILPRNSPKSPFLAEQSPSRLRSQCALPHLENPA
jgi:hypothetical protein